MSLFRFFSTFVIIGCLACSSSSRADSKRPNILLILLDDLGYADVGFNAKLFGVETDVVTPNIDALAAQSTIVKQAYDCSPHSCGPSRMALLSGRMPHCYGGQKNLPNVALNLKDYNEKGIPEKRNPDQQSAFKTLVISRVASGSGILEMPSLFSRIPGDLMNSTAF